MNLQTGGGTTLCVGMSKATSLYEKLLSSKDTNGNRVIYLTDMIPNASDVDGKGLFEMAKANVTKKIYTTFIGLGVGILAGLQFAEFLARLQY
jgi:Mg-chelatase subunit ChlD